MLGQSGLTIVLLDDSSLRRTLTAGLAAEFGVRVQEQTTSPEVNGVISASWTWWQQNQEQLPEPAQVIVALLPIASLSDPLTAARVERLKRQGNDWFRSLLLPEALRLIPAALPPSTFRRSAGCSGWTVARTQLGRPGAATIWNPGNHCNDCVRLSSTLHPD